MKRSILCLSLSLFTESAMAAALPTDPDIDRGSAETFHSGGGSVAKASRDNSLLMGPSNSGAPYIGDFENLSFKTLPYPDPRYVPPCNETEWYSADGAESIGGHWHVADYNAVNGTYSAWCGDLGFPSCDGGVSDPEGGYGSSWDEVLEWRGRVADNSVSTSVQISAVANIESETG